MVRTPYVDKNGLKKGAWSPEEDEKLRVYILRYGHWNWRELPKYAGLARCGKSCRLRWMNYLRPNVRHGNYSKEEEDLIVKLHEQLGNRWSKIAAKLSGRTDNEIKNHWHTHLKKRIQQQRTKSKKGKNRKSNDKSKPQNATQESNGVYNSKNKPYPTVQILESCPIFPSNSGSVSETGSGSSSDLGSGSDSSASSCSLVDATMESWDKLVDLVDSNFWTEPFVLDDNHDEDQIKNHEASLDANFWTDPFFNLENYENDRSLSFLEAGVSSPYTAGYLDMDFSYPM